MDNEPTLTIVFQRYKICPVQDMPCVTRNFNNEVSYYEAQRVWRSGHVYGLKP